MEVNVGYGLPRSLAVLRMGVNEFRTAESSLGVYLTCYGE